MMNRKRILLVVLYSLFLILLSIAVTSWMTKQRIIPVASVKIALPQNNCEIRTWYNFQVIAIDQQNAYWISQGLDLATRAQKAFSLRHNARKYARFMMKDKEEVRVLQERDLAKYKHPDGPTFDYLLQKNQDKGMSLSEAYESIIQTASQTNTKYNAVCH